MQQLEYDSYYKFLVSMGIILIITPGIILSIVDALDGCSQMLTVIKEYEDEMRRCY